MAEDALAVTPPPSAVSEEEQARAGVYALLGSVLAKPCSSEVRDFLDSIPLDGAGADVQLPWQKLQSEIASADLEELAHEYHALFVGLGRGELLPYGSVYLTGFLQEKPLADLRADLQRLGFEVTDSTHEPEDHAGALCEVMGIMAGSPDEFSHETQKAVFSKHLGSWMTEFFDDLIKAREGGFYRAVGEFGRAFIAIEKQYFAMEV
ncbi:MAG: molecular chaperone TorD family protein [Arenicellales bacterium]|nr:molecular chaperone TorD family protein [Arenicellales bacterium]MDP6551113.1 molecular chaperone TorD family protein [Arenicellales bacterium]MDP6790853.1 molecular chaperone TorD family protein [Arenicellales bacterium]MDP6918764.1 molecular chaperone TorD family protein [Arenicellales bacterium]